MSDAIQDFWTFWRETRGQLASAVGDGSLVDWVPAIAERVKAVHQNLDWEMGAGRSAEHYFCVSGKGDMSLRVITERWRAAGPDDDDVFELHAARPGGADPKSAELDFDGHIFPTKDFRFGLHTDAARRRVHVQVWHPTYAGAPEQLRMTATFIALDAVFGEDDVERWIGALELTEAEPDDATGFAELVAAVTELRDTEETFSVLRGSLAPDDAPVFVTVNLGVKRVDHLGFDLHLEIEITLAEPTPEGLTTTTEAEALNDAEDALMALLGHDAIFIGRETRRGQRVMHLHTANAGPVSGRIEAWSRELPWQSEVTAHLDPTWEVLRRW